MYRCPTRRLSTLAQGVHLLQAPDSGGIVAEIANLVDGNKGHITSIDIHIEEENSSTTSTRAPWADAFSSWPTGGKNGNNISWFNSRTVFTYDPTLWPDNELENDFRELGVHWQARVNTVRVRTHSKRKMAVFASKTDHCLVDLLHRWEAGLLNCDICCVISNHKRNNRGHVLRFLDRNHIPFHVIEATSENRREDEILACLAKYDPDFAVLARYMQILSQDFLEKFGKDIINLHHGLLPAFRGSNPFRRAYDHGVKLVGATCHFVTENLDDGPIIEQQVERISHRDNASQIARISKHLEQTCLSKGIQKYLEDKILKFERGTIVFQ